KRCANEQKKDERPRRNQSGELPELSAEYLHIVDIGGLKADDDCGGHREHDTDIGPPESIDRRDVKQIKRNADSGGHRKVNDANDADDYDWRIGGTHLLTDDGEGGRRKTASAFDAALLTVCGILNH